MRPALALALLALACGDDTGANDEADASVTPCMSGVVRVTARVTNHVDVGEPLAYNHNPPTAGQHYPRWAPSREFAEPLPRGYWIHNLEHGWLVLLYRPDADPAAIEDLRQARATLPADPGCPTPRSLLTPDPELTTPVAAVTWNHVIEGDRLDVPDIHALFRRCRGEAPEGSLCDDGDFEPQ